MARTSNRTYSSSATPFIPTDMRWIVPRDGVVYTLNIPVENFSDQCNLVIVDPLTGEEDLLITVNRLTMKRRGVSLSIVVDAAAPLGDRDLVIYGPGFYDNKSMPGDMSNNHVSRIKVVEVGNPFQEVGFSTTDLYETVRNLLSATSATSTKTYYSSNTELFPSGKAPVSPPANAGDGWHFVNSNNGDVIDWAFGEQSIFNTFEDIEYIYVVATIYTNRSFKLELLSDDSVWVYQPFFLPPELQGSNVLFYTGVDPVDIYPNLPHIEIPLFVPGSSGPRDGSEVITGCRFFSDSLPINTVEFTIYQASIYSLGNSYSYNYVDASQLGSVNVLDEQDRDTKYPDPSDGFRVYNLRLNEIETYFAEYGLWLSASKQVYACVDANVVENRIVSVLAQISQTNGKVFAEVGYDAPAQDSIGVTVEKGNSVPDNAGYVFVSVATSNNYYIEYSSTVVTREFIQPDTVANDGRATGIVFSFAGVMAVAVQDSGANLLFPSLVLCNIGLQTEIF